ncbi:MAG: hypothetical protein J4G18_18730 [Anaerolineae bacterium]|nr:hypothetical protein [Anaerolineae bacterium]
MSAYSFSFRSNLFPISKRWLLFCLGLLVLLSLTPALETQAQAFGVSVTVSSEGVRLDFSNVPSNTDYLDIFFNPDPRLGRRIYLHAPRLPKVVARDCPRGRIATCRPSPVAANSSYLAPANHFHANTDYDVTVTARSGTMPNSWRIDPTGGFLRSGINTFNTGAVGVAEKPEVTYEVVGKGDHEIILSLSAVTGADAYRISAPFPNSSGTTLESCQINRIQTLYDTNPTPMVISSSQLNRTQSDGGNPAEHHVPNQTVLAQPDRNYYYCALAPNTLFSFVIRALEENNSLNAKAGITNYRIIAENKFQIRTRASGEGYRTGNAPPATPIPTAPPALPSLSLGIGASPTSMTVSWNDVVGVDEYLLVVIGGDTADARFLAAGTTSQTFSGQPHRPLVGRAQRPDRAERDHACSARAA